MGYPTDCPQREKNGWTGDGHFAIETALYNYDGITVYEKWLADHRDEQQPNGVLPDIIPTGGWGYGTDNGLDWTSTIAIIPWNIYLFYGDSKLLADCYENIKRYIDYVDRTSPSGLTSWGRGDWVPVKSHSSKELTSSVYFYVDTKILANAAKLFNKQEDYKHYQALAEKIRQAINDKYLNRETGIYASGVQTELSVPLMWGIVPKDMKAKVARNLAKKVEEAGFHLDVGVLGAKAILNALSENGEAETAYKVAAQDTYPSWGCWIANGATTLLENWDLNATRDISDNHMMFGEIGGWFYKGLGGIFPDPQQPGFKHILLRPNFPSDLKQFEARHRSPYGEIQSQWERKKKRDWDRLKCEGIRVAEFFPAILGQLQMRVNYRNHRKIVVIDGKVGFVGGFNVGREYIGKDEKFGYWRDTHLCIEGAAVTSLAVRFVLDWNYAAHENLFLEDHLFEIPQYDRHGFDPVQIISSGPDSQTKTIHDNYLHLIHSARNHVYIQTPYFIHCHL